MAMKQRIHGKLLALEQRDLEGHAAYSLRLLLEGLTNANDARAAYTQILTGLEGCNRSGARARLCVLQQALECHGSRVLAELVPASVQALLAYIRKQHHVVNLTELSGISAALMDCLLPNLSQDLMDGASDQRPALHIDSKARPYPHNWTEALLNLFKPILKVACKGPEAAAMTAACTMLSVMLSSCAGHVHFTPVVQASTKLLAQLLCWVTPGGGLDRRAPGLFNVLQRCVQLMGIAADPTTLHAAIQLCLLGGCSTNWQMKEAACTALSAAITAICVEDPLFGELEPSLRPVQGVSKVDSLLDQGSWLPRPGDMQLGLPTLPPLVMTPAVQVMCQLKGAITVVLAEARYDRVTAVRKAATAASEQLSKLPGPAGLDTDLSPSPRDRLDTLDTNRHRKQSAGRVDPSPRGRPARDTDKTAQHVDKQPRDEHVTRTFRSTAKPDKPVSRTAPGEQSPPGARPTAARQFKAPPRVSGFRKGMGGAGGAAALYAAARPRHGFLQADKSKVSLNWSQRLQYHAQSHFQRPESLSDDDLDFGIQVFARPRPAHLVVHSPPAERRPPAVASPPPPPPAWPSASPSRPPAMQDFGQQAGSEGGGVRTSIHQRFDDVSVSVADVSSSTSQSPQRSGQSGAAASALPGSPLRDIHIHIQTNITSSNGASPAGSPRYQAAVQQQVVDTVQHQSPVATRTRLDASSSMDTQIIQQSIGTITSPEKSRMQHQATSPEHATSSSPHQHRPLAVGPTAQHRTVAVGTETSWFIPAQAAPVPGRQSPGPPAHHVGSPPARQVGSSPARQGADVAMAAAARGPLSGSGTVLPRAIDFRPLVQEAALVPDVQLVQAPATLLGGPQPTSPDTSFNIPGSASYDHVDNDDDNDDATGRENDQGHPDENDCATAADSDAHLGPAGAQGAHQASMTSAQAPLVQGVGQSVSQPPPVSTVTGRLQLQQLAAGQQQLDRLLSGIQQGQPLPATAATPAAQHQPSLQHAVPAAAADVGMPLPSPVAPTTLAALRTSTSAVAQSNSAALRDLEAMMQRLTAMKQELTASHLTSPQMPTLPFSLAAHDSTHLPAGLHPAQHKAGLQALPALPKPVPTSTAASQRLAALQAISARLGIAARGARAGSGLADLEMGVAQAASAADEPPVSSNLGHNRYPAGQGDGRLQAGLLSPAMLESAWGSRPAAPLPAAVSAATAVGGFNHVGVTTLKSQLNSRIPLSVGLPRTHVMSVASSVQGYSYLDERSLPDNISPPASRSVSPQPPPRPHTSLTPGSWQDTGLHVSDDLLHAQRRMSSPSFNIRPPSEPNLGHSPEQPLHAAQLAAAPTSFLGSVSNGEHLRQPIISLLDSQHTSVHHTTTANLHHQQHHQHGGYLGHLGHRLPSPSSPPARTLLGTLHHASATATSAVGAHPHLYSLPRPASPSSPPAFQPHPSPLSNTALLASPVMHWAARDAAAAAAVGSPRFEYGAGSFSRPFGLHDTSARGSPDGRQGSSSPARSRLQPSQAVVSARGRYDSPGRADDAGGRSKVSSPSRHVRHPLLHIRSPGSSRSSSPGRSHHHHHHHHHHHVRGLSPGSSTRGSVALAALWTGRSPSAPRPAHHHTHCITRDGSLGALGGRYPADPRSHQDVTGTCLPPAESTRPYASASLGVQSAIQKLLHPAAGRSALLSSFLSDGEEDIDNEEGSDLKISSRPAQDDLAPRAEIESVGHRADLSQSDSLCQGGDAGSDVLFGRRDVRAGDVSLGEMLSKKAHGAVGRMANAMLARLRDEEEEE